MCSGISGAHAGWRGELAGVEPGQTGWGLTNRVPWYFIDHVKGYGHENASPMDNANGDARCGFSGNWLQEGP